MTTNIANSSGYAVLSNKNTIGNVDTIGTTYTVKLNGYETTVKLVVSVSEDSGYQGYLYENLSNGELYLVHEGSVDPFSGNVDEIKKDWTITNTGILAASNVPAQFDDSKKFLDAVKNSSIYKDRKIIQIGQSLGGSLAEMNGALKENEKIETITFNSLGAERMGIAIAELRNLKLSGNYGNISNFVYLNEAVSKIAPHFGDIYIAKDFCTDRNLVHSIEFHQKDGLIYHYEGNYFTALQHIPSGYELKLAMNTLMGDLALVLKASGSVAEMAINELANALESIMSILQNGGEYEDILTLKGYVSMDEELYEIKAGDTIYGICDKYDVDLEELLRLNPWLADRFSDDMKFALIRPGEKLRIPYGSIELLENRPSFDSGFNSACGAKPIVDPMFLDLNNDGIIGTTDVENGVYFDHEGDGFSELSSWVSKEDGVLVIDKNNDGVISNGNEIFGDNILDLNMEFGYNFRSNLYCG